MGPRKPSRAVEGAVAALELPPLPDRLLRIILITHDDVGAEFDLPQYFRAMKAAGGPEFRASMAQRLAALADAGRQGEHAAAAAWLVRRCELLWSRGYFSKSREADQAGRPWAIVLLSTLAADYLCSRLAEGAPEAEALRELLCALLTLWRVAGAAGHEPAAKLRPTAAQAAGYATLACVKGGDVDRLPPVVWQEGGVLEALSVEVAGLVQQADLDPSPDFFLQAQTLISVATTLNELLLGGTTNEASRATWRWLIPACMEAGALAAKHPASGEPTEELQYLWQDLVDALKPVSRVLAAALLVSTIDIDQADISEVLEYLDKPAPYRGLAILVGQLVSACARRPPLLVAQTAGQFEQFPLVPGWWKPANDALTDAMNLAVALVGKREFQVEMFLDSGGMDAILEYLQFWGPEAHRLDNNHFQMHYHAGQLLDLVAYCMASPADGQVARELFGYQGLTLCIAALENMMEADLLVVDPGPDRWGACKSLLRALECACHVGATVDIDNCYEFVEGGGVEAVISAVAPRRAPPSESTARQNSQWRTTSLMRNGISLLASLVDAPYKADMTYEKAEVYFDSLVGALSEAFGQQDSTLPFGLLRLVQWGIVASLGEDAKADKMGAQTPSAHQLLNGALTLLWCAAEYSNAVLESITSHSAALVTLQRAGQQYLVKGKGSNAMGASRAWLETLSVLVRMAPACEEDLLSKGLFKTAGGVIGLAATYMRVTHEAVTLEGSPQLQALAANVRVNDPVHVFRSARESLLKEQGRELDVAAELFGQLIAQGTPTSVRCCETLLAAAGSPLDLPAGDLPDALNDLRGQVQAAKDMIARHRRQENAALERKAKEAEAAFAALMAEEEQQEQQQAATQAKKAAKRQKQKQRVAAEREAAAAAAAAASEAEAAQQAEQRRRREEDQRRQAERQQQLEELEAAAAAAAAEAGGGTKKKKKKKPQAAEPAGPDASALEQLEQAAGDQQQQQQTAGAVQQAAERSPEALLLEPAVYTPAAVAGLGPATAAAAAVPSAAGSYAEEPEEELQDLLAHLLPGMYPSSGASSAVVTPDVQPLGVVPPPPPPPPPQWLEQPQQDEAALPPPPQEQQQQQQQQAREWEQFPAQLRAVLSCPLTGGMLADPVILSDGHSYERHAAEAWLASNSCSPLTGEALDTSVCRPNHALRQLIEEFA